jgi:hypothetical protein
MINRSLAALALSFALVPAARSHAAAIESFTPFFLGGLVATFEGFPEATPIGAGVYPGVTFGQVDGGTPMIDNFPQLFGFGFSSGSGVLTGSTTGGAPSPTVAGLTAELSQPTSTVQLFFSDTAPLDDFTISAFGQGGVLLESLVLSGPDFLPPGYAGGAFPLPGTFPLPGVFVGFVRPTADILSVQIGPGSAADGNDAFAIDDFRFQASVPEAGSLFLLASGLLVIARFVRRG